jgi:hypothetical protein
MGFLKKLVLRVLKALVAEKVIDKLSPSKDKKE